MSLFYTPLTPPPQSKEFPIKKFHGRWNRRNIWLFPTEFRLFRGTETSQNSVPNPSAEEKTTRNSVPWNKNRSKLSNSVPNPFPEDKTTQNSVPWNKNRSKLLEFRSKPFRGRENISEQNTAGYKKTGLGELGRMNECMIVLCE